MITRYFLLKNWFYAVSHEIPNFWENQLKSPGLKQIFQEDAKRALKELEHERKLVDHLKDLVTNKRNEITKTDLPLP